MTYDELLIEADNAGITVKEMPLLSGDGRCSGNRIAIRQNMTDAQKADTLAEELEHHYTSVGNILDLNDVSCRKQERTARLRAYDRRIGLDGIIKASQQRCNNRYEIAEYLGVTEESFQDAIECYHQKYGCLVEQNGYTIFFEPSLMVMKKM